MSRPVVAPPAVHPTPIDSLTKRAENQARLGAEYAEFAQEYTAPEPPIESYPLAIPRDALYGYLGKRAKTLQMPLGWAYTSVLTLFAGHGINMADSEFAGPRPTLYTVLIGSVNDGKSEAQKRAKKQMRLPYGTVISTVPGSDKGLAKMFASGKKGVPMKLKPYVLVLDEFRTMMTKANIQGSALPSTLCTLWGNDEAGSADKSGDHSVNIRLSILGALAADPAEFAEVFGAGTQAGLFDRCLLAPGPTTPWDLDFSWRPDDYATNGAVRTTFPREFNAVVAAWVKASPRGNRTRRRLGEIAARIAVISSSASHERVVTEASLHAALRLMEWQESVRQFYAPGYARNPDAECAAAIMSAFQMHSAGDDGEPKWTKIRPLAQAGSWHRKYGPVMLNRTLHALRQEEGLLIAKYRQKKDPHGKAGETIDDYHRPTGEYRLRIDGVDDDASEEI
jgi:hypothetical protein